QGLRRAAGRDARPATDAGRRQGAAARRHRAVRWSCHTSLPQDCRVMVRVERDGGSRPVAGTPSDIVLGVTLAADPQAQRAAAERLRSLSAAARAELDASGWQASITQATEAAPPDAARPPLLGAVPSGPRPARTAPDAFGQLEAVVMQTFIQ